MPTAFVTGASGFLGRNLVPLLLAQGYDVRALCRSEPARERVLGAAASSGVTGGGLKERLQLVSGDLFDFPALLAGMQGADVVFHLAARAALSGRWADFEQDNVQGTHSVIQAAQAAGVRRLVHVSTEATCIKRGAWGLPAPMEGISEAEPQAPPAWAPYSATKALGEQAVLAANGKGGVETVVVRPHRLWGRGDTVILPALLGAFRAGVWRWFLPPCDTTATHVLNAASALLLAADKGRPGEVYFVTDGVTLATRSFFTRYAQAADPAVPVPQGTVPFWLAWLLATVLESVPFLPAHPLLNRQTLAVMGCTVTVKDDKIRWELGFSNAVSVEEGLAGVRGDEAPTPAPGGAQQAKPADD